MDTFVEALIRQGHVDPSQVKEAESLVRKDKTLANTLVQLGYCTDKQVAQAMAECFKMQYVDLDDLTIDQHVLELIPEAMARENNVMPVEESIAEGYSYTNENSTLVLAIDDPSRVDLMDSFRFILNRRLSFVVAGSQAITEAINQYYRQSEGESMDTFIHEMTDTDIDFSYVSSDVATEEDELEARSPAARVVDLMIREALQAGASDIHVEPFGDRVRVRYRIDGICIERSDLPKRIHSSVISRIMVLASMDITNKRTPSDGRIRTQVGDKPMDLRVSVVPSSHGLSCVMRLLDRDSINVGIQQLGMSEKDFTRFTELTRRPSGIILVTGPTGSGKTTTLYSAMKSLNTPQRKIITAEDPVEYNLPGVNQVEVNRATGLDFTAIIRSMLRQAPNVILVGEMRDRETAQMGVQAAQTGHLVLSTLHTNDAPSAVSRLTDLGIPKYIVSSSVIAVMAQRLVKTICAKCKVPHMPSSHAIRSSGLSEQECNESKFAIGKGCSYCGRTGYRGRIGIYELMQFNSEIRATIDSGASFSELRGAAIRGGMTTLFQDGMQKAAKGITTIEEIHRVAHDRTAEIEGVAV